MTMKMYEVQAHQVTLPSGTLLGLDKDQVRRRQHYLAEEGKHYRAKQPVNFKRGETVAADLDVTLVPKALLVDLGMSPKDIEVALAEARGEAEKPAKRGRKPADAEAPDPLAME